MRVEVSRTGEDYYLTQAWEIKEEIREKYDLLKQEWDFFEKIYNKYRVYTILDGRLLVGFAIVRRNGYVFFLAVRDSEQDEGYGTRLIKELSKDFTEISCHVREKNEPAISFYKSNDFEVFREEDNYYSDGENSYYMVKQIE